MLPLIRRVKDVGIWYQKAGAGPAAGAVYLAKGAGSLANSYINIANPGVVDLTSTNAPTFNNSTGWLFNGSSNLLNVSGSGLSLIGSFLIRLTIDDTSDVRTLLCGTAGSWLEVDLTPDHNLYLRNTSWGTSHTSISSVPLADTVIAVTISPGFVSKIYFNGVLDSIGNLGLGWWQNSNNIIGSGNGFYKNIISALAFYNIEFSQPQVSVISNAMLSL